MKIPSELTSRKFWVAILSFASFIASEQYELATGVVLGYLASQGVVDYGKEKYTSPTNVDKRVLISSDDEYEVDKSQLIAGRD